MAARHVIVAVALLAPVAAVISRAGIMAAEAEHSVLSAFLGLAPLVGAAVVAAVAARNTAHRWLLPTIAATAAMWLLTYCLGFPASILWYRLAGSTSDTSFIVFPQGTRVAFQAAVGLGVGLLLGPTVGSLARRRLPPAAA